MSRALEAKPHDRNRLSGRRGPRRPGLITVKGLRLLRQADVVIYDRLAPHELLREARPDAELIDGGKQPQNTGLIKPRSTPC